MEEASSRAVIWPHLTKKRIKILLYGKNVIYMLMAFAYLSFCSITSYSKIELLETMISLALNSGFTGFFKWSGLIWLLSGGLIHVCGQLVSQWPPWVASLTDRSWFGRLLAEVTRWLGHVSLTRLPHTVVTGFQSRRYKGTDSQSACSKQTSTST